jgi:hypothetical protein
MKTPSKIVLAAIATGWLFNGAVLSPQAQAATITGNIDFGAGTVTYDTNSLATATMVKTWTNTQVTLASGDFATFASLGDAVTMVGDPTGMTPWVFNPSTPTTPLWQVDGFTFNLASSTVKTQNAFFLNISGVGTVSGNGFDPTPATWSFTSTNANGQPEDVFTFTTETTPVPEASTTVTVLLGFVLIIWLARGPKAVAS